MEQTLLLNVTYEPIKIISWQRAMTLFYQNKVEILRTHDREARSVKFSFKLPAVVRLLWYAKIRQQSDFVPFTRSNIYARDEYTCQYCYEQFPDDDLTFDHVIPSSQGGTKVWENIVTCCVQCNRKKGGNTPQEAGMTLLKQPKRPSSQFIKLSLGGRRVPEAWKDFYWNTHGAGRTS